MLAILEPHIKKKTTNFCEISVQGSICALCCEMKWMNLTIAILDCGFCLYGGSELSKHLSKCLLLMQKKFKNNPIQIFLWLMKIEKAMCKRVWHNVRSYLFFNVRTFQTKMSDSVCNVTLSLSNHSNLLNAAYFGVWWKSGIHLELLFYL